MDAEWLSLFFCPLCQSECPMDRVVALDNCACLYCQSCLTVYLAGKLQRLIDVQTRSAFESHFGPGVWGYYVDDEGNKHSAVVIEPLFKGTWADSFVKVAPDGCDVIEAPYWRVSVDHMERGGESCGWNEKLCFACPCDQCHGLITKTEVELICHAEYSKLLEAETLVQAFRMGCIQCPYPECRCLIERLQVENSSGRVPVEQHGDHYRFRCAQCQRDFCGMCFARPYHAGYNCHQFKMPNCRYCDKKLDPSQAPALEAQDVEKMSVRHLKQLTAAAEADCSWCLEKRDFAFVARLVKSICHRQECRALLKKACTKKLPCGHACCGVRSGVDGSNHRHVCLPCFEPDCPASSAEYDGCQICWESFSSSPCIQLPCRHLIHLECARERVVNGFPGPSIGFRHLYCSMCGTADAGPANGAQIATSACAFDHPLLQNEIKPILQLRKETAKLALVRLKACEDINADELKPGGEFHGRPVDFAFKKYRFYLCNQCKKPYFGGARDCQAAAEDPGEFDPKDLICGSCCAVAAGQNCPRHGTHYIEWKCKFCCEVACWFCHGTTHYCDPCHRACNGRIKPCRGDQCSLKIDHPAPGTEFCLGCSLCRFRYE